MAADGAPDFNPGPVDGAAFRQMITDWIAWIRRTLAVSLQHPLDRESDGGLFIRNTDSIVARIRGAAGTGSNPYTWDEVIDNGSTYPTLTGGRSSDHDGSLYEVNGKTGLGNLVFEIRQSAVGDWRFTTDGAVINTNPAIISTPCCVPLIPANLVATFPDPNIGSVSVTMVYNASGFLGTGWYGCGVIGGSAITLMGAQGSSYCTFTGSGVTANCSGTFHTVTTSTRVSAIFFLECLTTHWTLWIMPMTCTVAGLHEWPLDASCVACPVDPSNPTAGQVPGVSLTTDFKQQFDTGAAGGSSTCSPLMLTLPHTTSPGDGLTPTVVPA